VELVRARVVEVLALEVDRAPRPLGEPARAVERRGPPAEVAQERSQLVAIGGGRGGLLPREPSRGQRPHPRLRPERPPVLTKMVLDVRLRYLRAHLTLPPPRGTSQRGFPATARAPVAAEPAAASCAPAWRAPSTAAKNARRRPGSLRPGAASVPL